MKRESVSIFQWGVIAIWFALLTLLVYGSGISLHYKVAPYFTLLSILLLLSCGRVKFTKVIKVMGYMCLLTIITSYHYYLQPYGAHRCSYINYLCYSLTGYLATFVSYNVVRYNVKNIQLIYWLMLLFYLVGILRFFRASSQLEYLYANTAYYYILMPLPLLLINQKSKIINMLLIIISTILCVLSVKRAAIVSIVIIVALYLYQSLKYNKRVIWIWIFIAIFFIPIVFRNVHIENFAESANRLTERMTSIVEDGGSGRNSIIYNFFQKDISDIAKVPEVFIGNGFEGIYYKYKDLSSLHNDYLEVIYSLGFIGFCLLIRFMVLLIRNIRNRSLSRLTVSYYSMVFLFLFFSFVGCSFNYYNLSAPLFVSLGVLEACRANNIVCL